jgi:predicted metal-dependent HD superfamily phosphohydrolase/GNAT superfamily N-acetyltransferase
MPPKSSSSTNLKVKKSSLAGRKKRSQHKGRGDADADAVATTDPLQRIADKWLLCTGRFAVPSAVALNAWQAITERYLEPQRHYHTLRHVQELLEQMQLVEAELEQPYAVILMIFFHDVVYDPQAKDNEDKSAELFEQFCGRCNGCIPDKVVQLVRDGILFTKHHMQCPTWAHKDIKAFLDMDIAILGSNKERYVEYMRQIRQEYRHVPHDVYGKARAAVLQQFVAVNRLFKTDFFRDRYESVARANLQYEISVLSTPEVASGRLSISDLSEVMQFLDVNYRINASGASPSVARESAGMGSSVATNCTSASVVAAAATKQLINSVIAGAAHVVPGALDDPLAMSEADVLHCITSNMDFCLAYRDDRSKRIICVLLCTRSTDTGYQLEARGDHSLMGTNVLLHTIVTQRDRRGRGLAGALFAELLGLLRQAGLRRVTTLCWKNTKQESFFRKQGFVAVRDVDMSLPGAEDEETSEVVSEGEEDDDEGDTTRSPSPNARAASPTLSDGGGRSGSSRTSSPTAAASSITRKRLPMSPTRSFSPLGGGGSPTFANGNSSFRAERSITAVSPASPIGGGGSTGGLDRLRMSFSAASNPFGLFGVDQKLVDTLRFRRRTAVEMQLTL